MDIVGRPRSVAYGEVVKSGEFIEGHQSLCSDSLRFTLRLCLAACGNSQQRSRVAIKHRLPFRVGAIHLLDLFRRHPVTQIEGVVGADHDVIRTDHAL